MHVYVYVDVYVYLCIFMYMCMYTYIYNYIYIHTRSTVGSPSVNNGVRWGGVGRANNVQIRVARRCDATLPDIPLQLRMYVVHRGAMLKMSYVTHGVGVGCSKWHLVTVSENQIWLQEA